MYNYRQSNRYFAQCAADIPDLATKELLSLGASDISRGYRGLYFSAEKEDLYRINLNSRLINRVLAPLITFDCHSDKYLYRTALKINWEDFLAPSDTFAVFASVSQSNIKHSKFAALRLKDAIADYFSTKYNKRPSVERRAPDVWFNLHIEKNKAIISLDTSGGSLHRRGYRLKSVQAPMSETVAASIIELTGWDGVKKFIDPMCGSGTLLCEAFLYASNTPPNLKRKKFGFFKLPDFDEKIWNEVRTDSVSKIKKLKTGLISGGDVDGEAVNAAEINLNSIDKSKIINLKKKNIFDIPKLENRIIVFNPPYGIRLNGREDLSGFYKRLGDFLKQKCASSTAYIYFGERKYIKKIGLRPSMKHPLINGGLDGRLAKFELY